MCAARIERSAEHQHRVDLGLDNLRHLVEHNQIMPVARALLQCVACFAPERGKIGGLGADGKSGGQERRVIVA